MDGDCTCSACRARKDRLTKRSGDIPEEKFTIGEIRNYLTQSDSFGDAVFHLSADSIKKANK